MSCLSGLFPGDGMAPFLPGPESRQGWQVRREQGPLPPQGRGRPEALSLILFGLGQEAVRMKTPRKGHLRAGLK